MSRQALIALALATIAAAATANIDPDPERRDLATHLAAVLNARPEVASCELPKRADADRDGLPTVGNPWPTLLAAPSEPASPQHESGSALC